MNSFAEKVLIYVIDISDGTPLNSGIIANIADTRMRDIDEVNQQIVTIINDFTNNEKFITFIDRDTAQVTKEFIQSGTSIQAITSILMNGVEVLILGGTMDNEYKYMRSALNYTENIEFLTLRPTVFTPITTQFAIEDNPSPLSAPNSVTRNLITEPSSTLLSYSDPVSNTGNTYTADLSSQTHLLTYQPNTYIQEQLNLI